MTLQMKVLYLLAVRIGLTRLHSRHEKTGAPTGTPVLLYAYSATPYTVGALLVPGGPDLLCPCVEAEHALIAPFVVIVMVPQRRAPPVAVSPLPPICPLIAMIR